MNLDRHRDKLLAAPRRRVALALLVAAGLLGVGTARAQDEDSRPPSSARKYQAFLLGNTGQGEAAQLAPTLNALALQLAQAGKNAAVVFLGDQLAAGGLPPEMHPARGGAEAKLDALIGAVRGFPGRVVFIPGENDYGETGAEPRDALERQEDYVQDALDRGNVFLPSRGKPGPKEIKLADDLRLVALDTHWLLQNGWNADSTGEAESARVYAELEDLVWDRFGDDLLFVGHHPVFSNGRYGGHPSPWYLLPALGTVAHAARMLSGGPQYLAHELNERMRMTLFQMLLLHESFVYASAHDFSLQYFQSERTNLVQGYVVSGSAARTERAVQGHEPDLFDTEFVAAKRGFVSISWYLDGSIWMDAWEVRNDGSAAALYENRLRRPETNTADLTDLPPSDVGEDSTVVIVPNPDYRAGFLRRLLMGPNHRQVWTLPVEVPVLDLEREQGGLTAIKRGGGQQTTSVRLENAEGRQFVLRSVNKDARRALPKAWQPTFIGPIATDLLSMSHPFSVMPVPPLADAVGVYHTNPRIVMAPDDARLGSFRDLIGGKLVLFEERPRGDMSDAPTFGRSEDVVGGPEMYRNVTRDNDNRVDDRFLVRNRLFDMWLSDWDRHKDQWRWATFDDSDGEGTVYRAIPRDRDNAFMVLDAFLAPVVKPFVRFQDFGKGYGSLKGLANNGRLQDHRFLGGLSRRDWLEIADSVQTALTDSVIEAALLRWPEAVYRQHGEDMLERALARRDQITDVAEKIYELHARSVDVMGSDKHERYEVVRLPGGDTEVSMFKTNKEGEVRQRLYHRVLHPEETREINLFALDGNDTFVIRGEEGTGLRINAVGGPGADTFIDSSLVGGVHFYDTKSAANTWHPGSRTHVHQSDDPKDNRYTATFDFERTFPIPMVRYNSEDGFILSGTVVWFRQAFRKLPWASKNLISARIASGSETLQASFRTTRTDAWGDWDIGVELGFFGPGTITNFYGLGNETSLDASDPFETGLTRVMLRMPFRHVDPMGLEFTVTPLLGAYNVDDQKVDDLVALSHAGQAEPVDDTQIYAGLATDLSFDYTDDPDNPRNGYRWTSRIDARLGVKEAPDSYVTASSSLALYASIPGSWQGTLAARAGGAHTVGTFPFYASNTLGSQQNLRGYLSTRFAGRSSVFFNAEVRLQLFHVRSALLPGRLGVLGFLDQGRVWTDGEDSATWHQGSGIGLWYNIVDEVLFNFTHGRSVEDAYNTFGFSFFF